MLLYDPPSGWKYGFPKPYLPNPGETLEQTLLRDGYPQTELDRNGGAKYVRFIGSSSCHCVRCVSSRERGLDSIQNHCKYGYVLPDRCRYTSHLGCDCGAYPPIKPVSELSKRDLGR